MSSKSSARDSLAAFDPELYAALEGERGRQEEFIEVIASENYVSPRVLSALGSTLTNKYADGYPGRREYSGCEFVDVAESLAIERAMNLFGAGYANVQPYSGSQANAAVYSALLEPGDTILGMKAEHGGHITHGDAQSFSGREFTGVGYGVDPESGEIDYEEVDALARSCGCKLIVAGFSAYSRIVDWVRFRAIADRAGAWLLADMAHVAGLVAAGLYPNPVPVADVVTSTTHKTLRGPRGGLILARDALLADRLDAGVYPGTQGGPLMHVVAAKAVAFKEASGPGFRLYQQRVISNARQMANVFLERGFEVQSGGTDNHMLIVELGSAGPEARVAVQTLERARIAVNGIPLPSRAGESRQGIRLGTPAVTTRGIAEPEARELAHGIADILEAPQSESVELAVRERVERLCERFPVYAGGWPGADHALPVL